MRQEIALAVSIVLLSTVAGPASADPQPAQQQVTMPGAEKIVLLVRNTLVTLNDALQIGKAPGFREANTAARLSQIFSDLAAKKVDLSAVTVIAPQLTQQPTLDQDKGLLDLKGYFPGQPVQINFELLYQAVGGRWRLFGISVQPSTSTLPAQASSTRGATPVKKKK
jgi:hypothetical protein